MKRLLLGALALSALAACRGQTSRDAPVVGIRNMYDQPRYDVQEESAFFPDHRTMRPLVEGVVAHDQEIDPQIAQGRLDDESGYVLEIPKVVVERSGGMQAMATRGKARYDIYCTPCHDGTGSGEGLVKRRAVASGAAAFVPPTFHQDRIRHMPDGQLFATITNGKSNMPPYAMQIPVDDRWAIVAYVRALQVAQPKLASPAPMAPTAVPGGTSVPAPGGTTMNAAPAATPEGASPAAATAPSPATPAADSGHEEKNP
ncbi:MAG: cytochrome c [Labilithrix sp.]|nr:cytochrome c [Labilithrix sp.]